MQGYAAELALSEDSSIREFPTRKLSNAYTLIIANMF